MTTPTPEPAEAIPAEAIPAQAIPATDAATVDQLIAAAAAAAPALADTSPHERAAALVRVAESLQAHGEELIEIAQAETGLSTGRLQTELKRTAVQLKLFADVVVEGSYLDARIDRADSDYVLGVRPDLRRVKVPVGPVLNFAASNFPFAFSVAGGDTASALAAGCPVIVKAHSGHPQLSARTAYYVATALAEAGLPTGTFNLIHGQEAGVQALKDDRIRAGAFTGSVRAGRLLADLAAARPRPIPFFGELGSINPVFVTRSAVQTRGQEIVSGLVGAIAGSAGQLCTKPGLVFLPADHGLSDAIAAEVERSNASLGEQRLLNPGIFAGFARRRGEALAAEGVRILADGTHRADADGQGWTTPTVVAVSLADFRRQQEALADEVFGPFTVLVEVPTGTDADADADATYAELVPEFFSGSLTATVHAAEAESGPELHALVRAVAEVAGRVLFGGWPTGVAVTYAQQHGGPWPATTNDSSTSVGTAAIGRFLRPVAFQSVPQELLPASVRDDNPWGIPQAIDAPGNSASWGSRA